MVTNTIAPPFEPPQYYRSINEAEQALQAAGYQRQNGKAWIKTGMAPARVMREAPGKFWISSK